MMKPRDPINPLLLTPRPHAEEALLPYLVRLTEANGYSDPMVMLGTAGVYSSKFQTGTVPLPAIAGLLACEIDDVSHLDHIRGPDALRSKTRWLLGHAFPSTLVRQSTAQVCPECIAEDGYVSVFWSLRHAVACPRHGLSPVSECTACGRTLRWRRPGLLQCECGAPIGRKGRQTKVSRSLRTALELIHCKVLNASLKSSNLVAAGYPLELLEATRPADLLIMAGRLAQLPHIMVSGTSGSVEQRGLEALHRVLEHWPSGFHRLLTRAMKHRSFSGYFSFGKPSRSLYCRLFRGPEADVLPYLESEFMHFGMNACEWGRPVAVSHTRSDVSLADIAGTAGVKPTIARRLIASGHIQAERAQADGAELYRCDLKALARSRPRLGVRYGPAQAADILNLPESVVARWAKIRHPHALGAAFHERDLYCLQQELAAYTQAVNHTTEASGLTVGRLLATSKYSPQQKALVLEALLAGALRPVGRNGSSLRSLVVVEAEVEAIARTAPKAPPPPDPLEMGVREAARILAVDPNTVFGLLDEGHLKRRAHRPPVQGGCRVDGLSLLAFAEKYVAAWVVHGRARGRGSVARDSWLVVKKRNEPGSRAFVPVSAIRGRGPRGEYVERIERLRRQLERCG